MEVHPQFPKIDADMIVDTIKNLDKNRTCGPSGIGAYHLNYIINATNYRNQFLKILVKFFNDL